MKTADLTDTALDWAVCKAAGLIDSYSITPRGFLDLRMCEDPVVFPSTSWENGGPIIEREHICWFHYQSDEEGQPCTPGWSAHIHADGRHDLGPTPLIAAMRCYVASKLGEEVNIPKELMP